MANYVLKDYQANIMAGLGTYTYTVAIAGMYFVAAQSLENPPSSLSISLAQTGSTSVSVTSTAPAAAQEAINIQNVFNCAIADVITITISSSAPIDNQLNTVKTIIAIHAGSN